MNPTVLLAAVAANLRRRLSVVLVAVGLALALALSSHGPAQAETPGHGPVLHVFWSLDCPVCLRQKPWLEGLEPRFPGLAVEAMELSRSPRAQTRLQEMAAARGESARAVPTLMLGPRLWVGDSPALRAEIETAIAAVLAGQQPLPDGGDGLRLGHRCRDIHCGRLHRGRLQRVPLDRISRCISGLPVLPLAIRPPRPLLRRWGLGRGGCLRGGLYVRHGNAAM